MRPVLRQLLNLAIALTTSITVDSLTDSNRPKSAGKLLKRRKRELVPKQQQKHYLIDLLSMVLRHRPRFCPIFGT